MMRRASAWMIGVLAIAGSLLPAVAAEMYQESTRTGTERVMDARVEWGLFIPGASSRPGASMSGPLAQTGWVVVGEPWVMKREETTETSPSRSIEMPE